MDNNRLNRRNYRVLQLSSVIVCVVTAMFLLTGMTGRSGFDSQCLPDEKNCVVLSYKDFTPKDGSYHLKYTGAALSYADVDHFIVDIRLDRPAPSTFSRVFKIMEDRWYGWNRLGKLTATFPQGATTPNITYSNQCCGATGTAAGAPNPLTDGTFWIGCTKKGKVKANGEKSGNTYAKIRLEKVNKDDGVGVKGKFTPVHTVTCK